MTNNTTTIHEAHDAVAKNVLGKIANRWEISRGEHFAGRRALYLSMEFLVGRAVFNNLFCTGLTDEIGEDLTKSGFSLPDFEGIEDQALGNGGLGRLAACFLDSAATLNLPVDGYGIRYKYGLFRQGIKDGFQTEEPDDWTKFGDPWSIRKENEAQIIEYADMKVRAVPYDMPVIGYGGGISTLRLWEAESAGEYDFNFAEFDRGDYVGASKEKILAENISRCLYPNDNSREGKVLRLRQEYFFSSASVKDALRLNKLQGRAAKDFAEYHAVQLNDTHPVIAIPELIRILIDDEHLSFAAALNIAKNTFNYTNHTIMPEALEKWELSLVKEILPRIYEIVVQINEAFIIELYNAKKDKDFIESVKIVTGGTLHMARLALFAGTYVNGVAEIHTELLKTTVLPEWYTLKPEKFRNKTNGITPRRWLALANPELSKYITKLLGSNYWVTNLDRLTELKKFIADPAVSGEFIKIKRRKKQDLANFIEAKQGVKLNPDFIFDVQIKRLHEYKRQLLNAFSILYIYFGLKDGSIPKETFHPTAFIFGAKSAPGYARAKGIIKYINEIAKLIDEDTEAADFLKVIFVENYNVSCAEKIVPAADVSEQISTVGTEASGTGNMKLMLNGAVTLGTLDGANIEIVEEAGEENNYIFGAAVAELESILPDYDPREIMAANPKAARVVETLIDGTVSDGGSGIFRELYFSLLEGASWHRPDNYYLLGDLESYVDAKLKLNHDYRTDPKGFAEKCWRNLASAGKFSSDRTIADYAADIWKIKPTGTTLSDPAEAALSR